MERLSMNALRDGNMLNMKYSIEPIVPSLHDLLRYRATSGSQTSGNSMKSTPTKEISDYFLKRRKGDGNIRKVRFAKFDVVHMYTPKNGRKHDMWWSRNELDEYRDEERMCSRGKSEQIYLKSYNEAFREISLTNAISTTMKRNLIIGSSSGFRGLENILSSEWIYTRRLDRRCIIASIIAVQSNLQKQKLTIVGLDVVKIIASHSEGLTRSHRIWSATIGETDHGAVTYDII